MTTLETDPKESNAQNPDAGEASIEPKNPVPPHNDKVDSSTATGILKDETFKAIHNAFQLGWSLYELKSRVLLASFEARQKDSTKRNSQQAGQNNPASDYLQAFIDALFEQAISSLASNNSSHPGNNEPQLPDASSENDWLRSVWRALFKQIADLHKQCELETDSSADADNSKLYSYPSINDVEETYPFLYKIHYPAEIGMPDTINAKKFGLPDIAYRALNCLALLYTDPKQTLSPITLKNYRDNFLEVISGTPPTSSAAPTVDNQTSPDSQGTNLPIAATPQASNASQPPPASGSLTSNYSQEELNAIKRLSGLIVKLLVIWDNYIREHLYAGGVIKNNDIELVAYEAGRSLAALPWDIAVRTIVLEESLSSSPPPLEATETKKKLYDAWQKVFNIRDIVHIQHQISALSQSMDDAYYKLPGTHRPDPEKDKNTVIDDVRLPTRSIHAIRHSLDYWQRSITWLGRPEVQQAILDLDDPSAAKGPSVSTQPAILTKDLAHDLRIALIQQSDVWHSLMTYEQNLSNFTEESVTLNILNDFMVKLELAMKKQFSLLPFIVGGSILALLFIVILFVIPSIPSLSSIASFLSKPPGSIVLIGTILAGGVHAVMTWLSRFRGIFGASGQAISDALQNGYKQLLIELGDLNYNVVISNALVAFFVMLFVEEAIQIKKTLPPSKKKQPTDPGPKNPGYVLVNDAYSFLTEIVWTDQERAEEIDRVANAAFGPLGTFIDSKLHPPRQKKQ